MKNTFLCENNFYYLINSFFWTRLTGDRKGVQCGLWMEKFANLWTSSIVESLKHYHSLRCAVRDSVSIPKQVLCDPYKVKPHRRRSFDATDSCALSQVSPYSLAECFKRSQVRLPAVPPPSTSVGRFRMATQLEYVEKSGNLKVIRSRKSHGSVFLPVVCCCV